MKYDAANKTISIGGIYENNSNQFQKRNGIELDFSYISRGEIKMLGEPKLIKNNFCLTQFGLTQNTNLLSYKDLNGY